MPLSKIRVLIVDDSITFRRALELGLSQDMNIEIIGTAMDAMDAMEKIKQLKPDVVTLDVEMPKMNGIEFLKKLMPQYPLPVVVVSSLPINALDALSAGAVDFVRKPVVKGAFDMNNFIGDLTVKVKIASKAHISKPRPSSTPIRPITPLGGTMNFNNTLSARNTIVAIGASTGGTEAILEVVQNLPATTPGIIIVQHMPPVFTNMYAQRLDRICKMHVKEAENGDRVEQGKIIIAAGEYHLRLLKDMNGYFIRSEPGPKVSGHCPSVDVMFDSVATTAGRNAVGVILTGMGADGAKGITKLDSTGAYAIGQDKDSCIVYGMPMEAFKLGGISKQLPLNQIGGEIIRYLNTKI